MNVWWKKANSFRLFICDIFYPYRTLFVWLKSTSSISNRFSFGSNPPQTYQSHKKNEIVIEPKMKWGKRTEKETWIKRKKQQKLEEEKIHAHTAKLDFQTNLWILRTLEHTYCQRRLIFTRARVCLLVAAPQSWHVSNKENWTIGFEWSEDLIIVWNAATAQRNQLLQWIRIVYKTHTRRKKKNRIRRSRKHGDEEEEEEEKWKSRHQIHIFTVNRWMDCLNYMHSEKKTHERTKLTTVKKMKKMK